MSKFENTVTLSSWAYYSTINANNYQSALRIDFPGDKDPGIEYLEIDHLRIDTTKNTENVDDYFKFINENEIPVNTNPFI